MALAALNGRSRWAIPAAGRPRYQLLADVTARVDLV